MIVGGYELHLYCDTGNATPGMTGDGGSKVHDWSDPGRGEFVGPDRAECMRQAKLVGWKFERGGFAICPRCSAR